MSWVDECRSTGEVSDGGNDVSEGDRPSIRSTWGQRRRQLLGMLAAPSVSLLAGCSGGSDTTDGGGSDDGKHETGSTDTDQTVSEPELELGNTNLSAETVTAGEELTVTVTVENVGTGDATFKVPLTLGQTQVDEATVELAAGEESVVELTGPVSFLRTETVAVAGKEIGEVTGEPPGTIHVDPDGSSEATGLEEDPFGAIQHALDVARPGDIVHVGTGTYTRQAQTVRAGTFEEPITITGPREAIYRCRAPFEINHSHVHLTGLTFDGLLDPDKPDDDDAYSESLLQVNEAFFERIKTGERSNEEPVTDDEYLNDVVVKPAAVGNCRADFVKIHWSRDVEIGEFEVIGPAGVKYLYGESEGHNGEIVYIGNPINKGYPIDKSSEIHVHHIDNSEGYEHNELVDVKGGARDVLIEYCTDAGGGRYVLEGADETSECVIHLGGRECVLRWCAIEDSQGQGVEVASWGVAHPEEFEENTGVEFPEEGFSFGQQNSIYDNEFMDHDGLAVEYPVVYPDDGEPEIADGYGPEDQAHICGNEFDGETHGSPDAECGADLPKTDRIGHLGGDSPWA